MLVVLGACGPRPAPGITASTVDRIATLDEQGSSSTAAGRGQTAAEGDREWLERIAATRSFRLGRPQHVEITADGRTVLFLRSGPRSFEQALYALDVASGTERVLCTAEALLGTSGERLTPEERARRERLRRVGRGITDFEPSTDGRMLLVPVSGRLFLVDVTTGGARELPTGGPVSDAHLSPDGRRVGFVREGALWILDVAGGTPRRLSPTATDDVTYGVAEFVAQEEMHRLRGWWFSPDGRRVLYQKTDESEVDVLTFTDPLRPEQPPHRMRYPRAGRPNAKVSVGVVSVDGGSTTWLRWDERRYPYLAAAVWPAGRGPVLVVQDRLQRETAVLEGHPEHGWTQPLHVERDAAWVNLDPSVPRFFDGGRRFLWSTERDGSPVLEVRRADATATDPVPLTRPEDGYERVLSLDERNRHVWIVASGEPTESHVLRVPLDPTGEAPERMTVERGVHDAVVGPDELWVRISAWPDARHELVLLRGRDVVAPLRSVAERPPFAPRVEWLTVGERDWRVAVVWPRNFDPARRYPVLASVYGGPGHRTVRADGGLYWEEQWHADRGYVVVSVDGRGTPGRGREWERTLAGNFAEAPLADLVSALDALRSLRPQLDLQRVGIWGWSFGGWLAALAVMRRPDVFRAAVSGAPVTDWAWYDTHYTERYLGLPADNPEGYRASSLLTYAAELRRPLLLVHGTADDNVHFAHTLALAQALFRAGRPFELVPLSDATHLLADPELMLRLHERMAAFFDRHVRDAAEP